MLRIVRQISQFQHHIFSDFTLDTRAPHVNLGCPVERQGILESLYLIVLDGWIEIGECPQEVLREWIGPVVSDAGGIGRRRDLAQSVKTSTVGEICVPALRPLQ